MQKIVINTCFGGFGLSSEAFERYKELSGRQNDSFYDDEICRNDPNLVRVVGEMGSKASGLYANLEVVEIPDGVDWQLEEYDGNEHVAEAHRTWP